MLTGDVQATDGGKEPSQSAIVVTTIYVLGSLTVLATTVLLVSWFCRHRLELIPTLGLTFLPYAFLAMVQMRCRMDAAGTFGCGWMSFMHGISWHILPIALGVGIIAYATHRFGLTEAAKPLSGAWLALLWYI